MDRCDLEPGPGLHKNQPRLGYKFAAAYPIFDREEGNKIMYYMIHASDHEDAPALMVRAHSKAVRALPKETQMQLIDIEQVLPRSLS